MRLRKLKKSSDKRFPFFHSNKRFPVLSQGNWAKLKNIYPWLEPDKRDPVRVIIKKDSGTQKKD